MLPLIQRQTIQFVCVNRVRAVLCFNLLMLYLSFPPSKPNPSSRTSACIFESNHEHAPLTASTSPLPIPSPELLQLLKCSPYTRIPIFKELRTDCFCRCADLYPMGISRKKKTERVEFLKQGEANARAKAAEEYLRGQRAISPQARLPRDSLDHDMSRRDSPPRRYYSPPREKRDSFDSRHPPPRGPRHYEDENVGDNTLEFTSRTWTPQQRYQGSSDNRRSRSPRHTRSRSPLLRKPSSSDFSNKGEAERRGRETYENNYRPVYDEDYHSRSHPPARSENYIFTFAIYLLDLSYMTHLAFFFFHSSP